METPKPSISSTAFACPHCGAFAKQHWSGLGIRNIRAGLPSIPDADDVERLEKAAAGTSDSKEREQVKTALQWAKKMRAGEPFGQEEDTYHRQLANLFASQCFNCHRFSLWVHDKIVYPTTKAGAAPHPDLPQDPRADYEEARAILELSPRGAAALLRLCVQKLCVELGEKGNSIDADIGALVAKGLDPMIQQALDSVRVIGNESVHPGQIDLRDDRDTAVQLFELVNDITAQTLTRRKRAKSIYDSLPPEKRAAIDARNAKALESKTK
jgi:hypothetical protein